MCILCLMGKKLALLVCGTRESTPGRRSHDFCKEVRMGHHQAVGDKGAGQGNGMRRRSLLFMERITRGFLRRGVRGRRWSGFGGLIRVILGVRVGRGVSRRNEEAGNEEDEQRECGEKVVEMGKRTRKR